MANILTGGGVVDIRGSIGGSTFAKNAAGIYARAKTKPCNPRSPGQEARRTTLSLLTAYWRLTLNQTKRDTWEAYSMGTTWKNVFGNVITIPPISAFVRTNALRLLVGDTIIDTGPNPPGHAGNPPFAVTKVVGSQKISITSIGLPWGSGDPHDYAIFHMSLPDSAGRLATPKTWAYLGKTGSPGSFPFLMDAIWPFTNATRVIIALTHMDEAGRVGSRVLQEATVPL